MRSRSWEWICSRWQRNPQKTRKSRLRTSSTRNQGKKADFLISFFIFGHKNIKATHRNTLEFTKDAEVSARGDCILGIRSDFSKEAIRSLMKHERFRLTITIGQ